MLSEGLESTYELKARATIKQHLSPTALLLPFLEETRCRFGRMRGVL